MARTLQHSATFVVELNVSQWSSQGYIDILYHNFWADWNVVRAC